MHWKNSYRPFGLLLLASLSLLASMATSASAVWLENGSSIASNKTVIPGSHVEGNLKVPTETFLEVLCAAVGGVAQLLSGSSNATGSISFSLCKTWQAGKNISASCTPAEPIKANILALLLLHNSKNYILVLGETSATIAQVKFNGETCALPEINNVKGSMVLECLRPTNLEAIDCAQQANIHLLAQNAILFADSLTYGTKSATLSGIGSAKLFSGNVWGGHV